MAINVGTAYVEILPSTNKLAPHIRQALGATEKDSARAGSKAGKGFGAGFKKLASPLIGAGLGTALIGFNVAALKTRAEFGKTMNQVKAVSGIGEGAMKRLEKQAIDLGDSTVFSANEAADAMLELAKAGMKPAEIEAGGLKGTLKLAAAAGTDMATAATIAGNALNTFKLRGKDMNKVANALAGGANASTASVESLGEALGQVGPGAKNAGLDINETVGVLAAFDSAGIKGSDAGTSLKTMLARLVPQTDKAAKKMKELDLNFINADGSFKSITEISGQLNKSLGGLSDSAKTDALNTLFGSDASRAASVLMEEGTAGISKYIKATKDKKAADRAAEAGMKGISGALERLSGAWETFMLKYGGGLEKGAIIALDGLAAVVSGLGPAITFLGDAFSVTVEAIAAGVKFVKEWAVVIGLGAIALAGLNYRIIVTNIQMALMIARMGAASIATKVMAAATKAWAIAQRLLNLALRGNPIGLVITAIAALAAGFVILYKKNETFRKLVNRVWASVKTWIVGTWKNHIKPALQAFGNWITTKLVPAIKWLWSNGVKPTFKYIGNIIKTMWNRVIKPAFSAMRTYISKVLVPVIKWLWSNGVKPAFKSIGSAISIAWKYVIKPAFTRMASMVRGLPAAFRAAKKGIASAWSAIKAAVAKPINFVINTVWNDGLRKVINAIPGVKDLGRASDIPGYASGGWTGPGAKYKPAGIVHGDEFVINKASRRKFETAHPGVLDHLNNYGELPGYAKGGVVWPTTGRLVSSYPGHDGIDINGPGQDYGNPIFAFRDGVISYVGSGRGYGAPAIFERTSVGEVVYGHASSALVRAGQSVKAGQVIGRIGSTGNSTGPHLHFGFPGGTPGAASAALGGATTKHGGAGGFPMPGGHSIGDWLAAAKKVPGMVKDAWTGMKKLGNTGWGKEIAKAGPTMFKGVAKYADNKIPDFGPIPDNPIQDVLKHLGVFDNGGVLEPGQLAFNASKKPEAVYNHKQFKQFAEATTGAGESRRVAMTITNWKTGEGYMEEIAERAVDGNARFNAQIGRMR